VATFVFETITAAQALAFNGAADTLVFTSASQIAANQRLIFDAEGTIRVFSTNGLSATFGPGLAGAQIIFPDSSQMLVGSSGGDVLTGGAHGDGLFGGYGADTLNGGAGDDVLQGGPGADVLTGGGGRDLFIFSGESPPVAGQMDTITDWSSGDALSFFRGTTDPATYVESSAADFASAKAFADAQIGGGTVEYVSMQVGGDVIVFADSHGNHGVADDAVILAGRTLADIDASNIVTTAPFPPGSPPPVSPPPPVAPPPPVSPPVSPPPAVAHGVTAVISGGIDTGRLTNLLDNGDVSVATSTTISLQDGTSSMTLSGFGFTYDGAQELTGGTVTEIDLTEGGVLTAHVTGLSLPVTTLLGQALQDDDSTPAVIMVFAGSDSIVANGAGYQSIFGFSGDDTIQATSGASNTLFGNDGDDSLAGALSGSNTLIGGSGADTMAGGDNPAGDHFPIGPGDSPEAAGLGGHPERLDHILNWNRQDIIEVPTVPAGPQNYTEVTAASYDQAYAIALSNNPKGIYYTVAQVGADLVVFDPLFDAFVISNRTLADFSITNFSLNTEPAPFQASGGEVIANGVLTGTVLNEHFNTDESVREVHAGGGDDTIIAATQQDVIRGDDGNDSIQGAAGFDDINGNKGNDTIDGGTAGSDWLLGGQGDDSITAHHDQNQIYGNLGNDTLHGGDGGDIVRGGQGDDVIVGGAGKDFISGDRGNDTITGGAGADIFHSFSGAGIDRVLDFNAAEGDRVMLDPGTAYTVRQVGADTVVDMGSGDQLILVGVQLSSLPAGWIFLG
jgi:Ca2+-binding RTX toxin-like protein